MLGNLDAAASDALQSFSSALAQAQHTLQKDQARLDSTANVLRELSNANANVRARRMHNTQELQRLDALRAEKAKLTRLVGHKREHVQSCQAHMQQLKQPRLTLMEAVETERREVMALWKHYCIRAAQVHAYVAQLLLPQNSLENLQRQRVQLQRQRREAAEATAHLKEKLGELQQERAALEAAVDLQPQQKEETRAPFAVSSLHPPNPQAHGPDYPTEYAEEGVDAGAASGLSTADGAVQLEAKRAEQQAAYEADQARCAEEETRLQHRREDLKQLVLELCSAIESADAAQQAEQQTFHDALNQAASTGTSRTCSRCHGDLLAELS